MNIAVLRWEIYVAILGLVIFILDMIVEDKRVVSGFSIIGMLLLTVYSFINVPRGIAFYGAYVQDAFSIFLKRVFFAATFLAFLGAYYHSYVNFRKRLGEYYLLLTLSLLGMMFAVSSRDLILVFVAFELISIPLYILAGFHKHDERSVEAALKFFIFGALSSAVLLLGFSYLLVISGTTSIQKIASTVSGTSSPLLLLAIVLILAGLGFKIAAVPFHLWVPDTYEGAPAPFVAFLSVAPKAAGFGIIFRVFYETFSDTGIPWLQYAAILAGITMIVGNFLALPQTNIKRLLSYSGIAHIGYMLLGLAAGSTFGVAMVLFYFVSYLFSNMGAFFVVEAVWERERSDTLETYNGLSMRSPTLALAMLVFLLSLGGIPFVVGFWAKLYVFLAAAKAGLLGLVLLGALLTVLALFYYLNVARKMYIEKPVKEEKVGVPSTLSWAIIISALFVVILGLYPKLITVPALHVAKEFLMR